MASHPSAILPTPGDEHRHRPATTPVAAAVDAPTFEDFHRARARAAMVYARAILGPDGAEDACQEAWLRAWRAWGSADEAKIDAWLRTIVRNCCRDGLGHLERAVHPIVEDDLPLVVAAEDVVLDALEEAALLARIRRLPEALRETLWLREVHELTYLEIADRQGIPVGTVMSRLHAARGKVRRSLPPETLDSAAS